MSATRFRRALGDWRNWWNLAFLAFTVSFLPRLLGMTGPMGALTESAAKWGLPIALCAGAIGFGLLHVEQESASADAGR